MKSQVLILAVLMVALLGCKKDIVSPTEQQCVLWESESLNSYAHHKTSFYYNRDKKLVGRADYENIRFSSGLSIFSFDSIVYVSNTNVVVYRYALTGNVVKNLFNKDTFPQHSQTPSKKTEFLLVNNRVMTINYFAGATNAYEGRDSLVYEGDKLVKIHKWGTFYYPNWSTPNKGERIATLTYDGNNLKSLIYIDKDRIGDVIGGDTTLYHTYPDFKNPYTTAKYIPDLFINAISENLNSIIANSYYYQLKSGDYTGGSTTYGLSVHTNNGKGYPKEAGIYKCD
jgi:hypothetical protein